MPADPGELSRLAGSGAGLLAGLIGVGGGIVVVPVVYCGLLSSGIGLGRSSGARRGQHIIGNNLPGGTHIVDRPLARGHSDLAFLREWGPGIVGEGVLAQFTAPHLRGAFLIAVFASFSLLAAARFAAPGRFRPSFPHPPVGVGRDFSDF